MNKTLKNGVFGKNVSTKEALKAAIMTLSEVGPYDILNKFKPTSIILANNYSHIIHGEISGVTVKYNARQGYLVPYREVKITGYSDGTVDVKSQDYNETEYETVTKTHKVYGEAYCATNYGKYGVKFKNNIVNEGTKFDIADLISYSVKNGYQNFIEQNMPQESEKAYLREDCANLIAYNNFIKEKINGTPTGQFLTDEEFSTVVVPFYTINFNYRKDNADVTVLGTKNPNVCGSLGTLGVNPNRCLKKAVNKRCNIFALISLILYIIIEQFVFKNATQGSTMYILSFVLGNLTLLLTLAFLTVLKFALKNPYKKHFAARKKKLAKSLIAKIDKMNIDSIYSEIK